MILRALFGPKGTFMKHVWLRYFMLALLFILLGVGYLIFAGRRSGEKMTFRDTQSEAFPLVSFLYDKYEMNTLYGYAKPEGSLASYYVHDTICPMAEDHEITIRVRENSKGVIGAYYQLYDMAGERLYEEQQLTLDTDGNRMYKAVCNPTKLLGQGEEGLFCLFLKLDDGREVFYPTRVAYYEGTPLDEAFTLSASMIEAMLSKNTISLQQYMSFTGSDAQMNLNHVTLESTPRQATWAGLEPRVSSERTLRIYEISSTQIEFSWLYTAQTIENEKEIFYDVEEYFSFRRRSEKNYILAYERFMQEKFPTDGRCMGTTSILLGIQNRDNVSMFKDASGKKVAFTVDHGVYAYNYANNEMTQVLAFDAGSANTFIRDRMYKVRILNMNEDGDLNLAVSGYFPSGSHEGECGLALYYYDNENNALKEVTFVRLQGSYEMAIENSDNILYASSGGLYYYEFGGVIYSIDRKSGESQIVARDVTKRPCVSADGAYAAWDASGEPTVIFVLDMESGKIQRVENRGGEIKALGFIEHDLVYSVWAQTDYKTVVFDDVRLMKSVHILDTDLNEQMTYEKDGIYIESVDMERYSVVLHRVSERADGTYEELEEDVLTYTEHETKEETVALKVSGSNIKFNYYYINFGKAISTSQIFGRNQSRLLSNEPRMATMLPDDESRRYTAYYAGRRVLSSDELSPAITAVYDSMGTVLEGHEVVWSRGSRNLYVTLTLPDREKLAQDAMDPKDSIEMALLNIKEYEKTAADVNIAQRLVQNASIATMMEELFGDRMVNLSGCSTTQILYYMHLRHPVLALTDNGRHAVVLYGYNSVYVYVYDPVSGEKSRLDFTTGAADEFFESAGSLFISYR